MPRPLTDAQIAELRLQDADLLGIDWMKGDGPTLRITLEGASGTAIPLLFTWVSELCVDLDLRKAFKAKLWDHRIAKRQDGRWQVILDFAGSSIQLECEGIALVPAGDCVQQQSAENSN